MESGKSGGGGRKFSPELLNKIRESVNIVDIVGEHVVLRKSGSNHSGLCPFHSERSPSFSVSESKQLYHCYGCKKGGDLFSFVMEIFGITFPEAIEELAERARIPLPSDWGAQGGPGAKDPEAEKRREAAREKASLAYKLNRFAAAFFHQSLAKHPEAERYFRLRGVDDELLRNFYLGASLPSWDALASFLVAKKAPLPLAVELGLIRPSQKGQGAVGGPGYFDLFRNRVMFPILDLRGKVAGFGGRGMPDPATGKTENPKYLNSAESFVFQKSKLAYGLFQAQKHIRERDEVIVVEGYFDVLALHAAGFQNVVATCGTSLTPEHLAIFRRFASRITILFDTDKAGISATERAMELGLDHGLILLGAEMPPNVDPDELLFDQETGRPVPSGKERMTAILSGAKPLLDARIDSEVREAMNGPEARTQALKKIGGWLARYSDQVGREVRIQHVQNQLAITRELLAQAMSLSGGGGKGRVSSRSPGGPQGGGIQNPSGPWPGPARSTVPPKTPSRPTPKPGSARIGRGERILLGAIARGEDFSAAFQEARGKLPTGMTLVELFDYEPARIFMGELEKTPGGLGHLDEFLTSQPSSAVDPQVRSILMENRVAADTPFTRGEFQAALGRRIASVWAQFSQRIRAALIEAEAKKDAGLYQRLSEEYLDVQRKMKEFNSFYDEA